MIPREVPAYQLVDMMLRHVLRRAPESPWAERTALWWGPRFRGGPRVVSLHGGVSMLVEPRDYMLTSLYYLGTFEPYCLRLLPQLLPVGGTLLDVGANIGVYTLTGAKRVGPQGRVISVEPGPGTAAALRANVARNGFSQVTVLEMAAGPEVGQANLVLPRDGNSGMYTLGDDSESGPGHSVEVRRLDDVLDDCQVERVDLVKMDIEGSEYGALLGARALIETHRPSILIELNDSALQRRGHGSDEVKQFLLQAGYKGWLVSRRGLSALDRTGTHECDECLFVHESSHTALAAIAGDCKGVGRCA